MVKTQFQALGEYPESENSMLFGQLELMKAGLLYTFCFSSSTMNIDYYDHVILNKVIKNYQLDAIETIFSTQMLRLKVATCTVGVVLLPGTVYFDTFWVIILHQK